MGMAESREEKRKKKREELERSSPVVLFAEEGFGLKTAFLLDMQLLYSYIQPNQKRVFIVFITGHGFWREVILVCLIAL